jgi:hypothetical protein
MKKIIFLVAAVCGLVVTSCSNNDSPNVSPIPVSKDINTAVKVSVDRFSTTFGHLQVRTATNGLPAANVPVNFDTEPFITTGLDRTGTSVKYYNFDVQSTIPEDIYIFFKSGSTTPLTGQNNIIPTIPGEVGYNDFWLVNKVIVPDNYVPNSITSEAEVLASGYTVTKTNSIVNCPVVPFGSTASKSNVAGVASVLTIGWYKGKAVAYFNFDEVALTSTSAGLVPTSPIYVTFNIDPAANNPASGPASGFKTETGTLQTHNVIATNPADGAYSPLWSVQVLSNVNFGSVSNLATATSFASSPAGANVNCPVVK